MPSLSLATLIAFQCRDVGLPEPVFEHRFHPVRRWRFDAAWLEPMIAMEIDGGVWTAGRHVRGKGFEQDCVKGAEAILLGWRVLHATPQQVRSGTALQWLSRLYFPHHTERGKLATP